MYSEFMHDPKVQMMTEAMQRRLVMLFCFRSSNGNETLHETEIAFLMRVSSSELAETKQLFIAKGFINSEWDVLNWNKRQYVSDSSSARVSKHRDKVKRMCNVSVTPPDTDTDTDTEKDKDIVVKDDIAKIPFREIVEHLNLKTGMSFRASTKQTQTLIRARWKEGFKLDDFKKVIDRMYDAWGADSKMMQYLRPITLFGTKFEGYLNRPEKHETEGKPF